ncbi:MAG TPA: DNA repair protein RadA [Candidatus Dependentiae bacterium]|nr:DNA repair protein RadA [Candidatus Dependentiae bacterium]
MSSQKNIFVCSECNYKSIKWIGCCPGCQAWDSFHEETQEPKEKFKNSSGAAKSINLVNLSTITTEPKKRMESGIEEWDRVLGGGIMPGSLLILTGDPGIGKSTLLLQICDKLSQNHTVHYFSTEESLQQVNLRARRITGMQSKLLFSDNADLESILEHARNQKPDILIIDSIQNCFSHESRYVQGSINQLRDATFQLMRLAKNYEIAILMSGHITKDGMIAGPKTLEHMVDGVFYLQGEDRWQTRILRSVKNRFGTINEIGFFEMRSSGLEEVCNINEHLIAEITHAPGSVLISFVEGSRPLLLELQALTIDSKLSIPQRVVSGVDQKQVVLIAAILEKYLHIRLSSQDIFFKVSGGFKIKDSSTDLGIALALLSSYFQQPLPQKSIALGEINLTGHIHPINQINLLIREAEKFGIGQLLVAKNQKTEKTTCSVKHFSNVYELLSLFQE